MLPTFGDFLSVVTSFLHVEEWAVLRQVSRSLYFGLMSKEEAQQFYSQMSFDDEGTLYLTCGKITMFLDADEFRITTDHYTIRRTDYGVVFILDSGPSVTMAWDEYNQIDQSHNGVHHRVEIAKNTLVYKRWPYDEIWGGYGKEKTVLDIKFLRRSEIEI
jgi:hypothetical protein